MRVASNIVVLSIRPQARSGSPRFRWRSGFAETYTRERVCCRQTTGPNYMAHYGSEGWLCRLSDHISTLGGYEPSGGKVQENDAERRHACARRREHRCLEYKKIRSDSMSDLILAFAPVSNKRLKIKRSKSFHFRGRRRVVAWAATVERRVQSVHERERRRPRRRYPPSQTSSDHPRPRKKTGRPCLFSERPAERVACIRFCTFRDARPRPEIFTSSGCNTSSNIYAPSKASARNNRARAAFPRRKGSTSRTRVRWVRARTYR